MLQTLPSRLSARRAIALLALVMALLLSGCRASTPIQSQPQPTPTVDTARLDFTHEEAVIAAPLLVQAERNAAASGDLPLLALLWAEEATIKELRDAGNEADDYIWQGRDAILDRYEVAVAQNRPTPLDAPPDAPVTVTGDMATLINGVDTWTFVRVDGRWWIAALTIAA